MYVDFLGKPAHVADRACSGAPRTTAPQQSSTQRADPMQPVARSHRLGRTTARYRSRVRHGARDSTSLIHCVRAMQASVGSLASVTGVAARQARSASRSLEAELQEFSESSRATPRARAHRADVQRLARSAGNASATPQSYPARPAPHDGRPRSQTSVGANRCVSRSRRCGPQIAAHLTKKNKHRRTAHE
jgi:hypothetical protein